MTRNLFLDPRNTLFDFYKHHLQLFVKFSLLLVLVGLFERSMFALYHSHLSSAYSITETLYTLLWGLRFDVALAGFFSLLALLISYLLNRIFSVSASRSFKYLAYLSGSIIFILQGADIIYFSDAARHIGYEITDSVNDAPHLLATAWTLYKTPLIFHLVLYPVLLVFISRLFRPSWPPRTRLNGFKKLHTEAVYLLLVAASLVMARGGLQSIPIEPLHAQEISDSGKASLALNGAYNAIFYLFNKDVIKPVPVKLPATLDTDKVFKSLYANTTRQEPKQAPWKPNIIFILLESWPAMYMQSYGYDKDTTPFFDSLRKKSLTTLEMIAGGHRTTEGMFASFCSVQNPLGQTIAQSQLQDYGYRCLPHILRAQGYRTAFFQGSNKNTSGTGAFAQLLGFSESYGKADIAQRQYEENDWGVYDQDLYAHVYKALKNNQAPVLFGINTNTTHDIAIPAAVNAPFKLTSSDPRNLNALYFADSALEDFFNKVEQDPEIGDTLWVIVADHTAGLKTSRLNNYRVPFLIYHKEKLTPQLVRRVASQRDIA
ncbi:MAG: sulfatase-like hydrolase/transferase, partial [Thioalkalispiraceae bacterium]